MITISDGILTIPEGERFVGFAGDNRHTRKKFFIRSNPESGWLYRLYLTFDDGRHNFFVLPATVSQEGTFLEWNIEEDHILKSGLVKAQIKAFSEDNEVYHTTSDVFVAGKTTEEDEEFKNSNSEFLSFEKTLNELYEKMNKASAQMPYVGTNGNWMCFDEKTGAYKDTGISSAVGVGDKSITPQKLDRPYWERKTAIDTQVDKVEDLFDAAGFLNSGGSIAFLNVNLTVNIGDDKVELAKINGYCYAVGVKFVSGDTVYLINVTDGTKWKINRYNEGDEYVPLYRLECMRLGLAESSVTPAELDRTYLEKCVTQYGEVITSFRDLANKVGYINRGGNLGFVKLLVSNSENDTVNNYGYIDGEFIAVGSPSGRNVYLLNISNGETWTVSAKDDGTYYAYKVDVLTPRIENLEKNAKIVFMGMINDVSELYDYSFSKDYLYHFYASGAFGGKLVGTGYCYGRYTPVTDPETGALTGKLLEVFNSSTLKVYNLNIGEGTAELITAVSEGADGYTPVKGVDYYTEEDKAEFEEYIASELAKRGQLKPEFANSIAECTNTAKLYVLPDGLIYAYMLTEVSKEPTNLLPLATDTDRLTIYNSKGFATDTRLSGSSGTTSTSSATGIKTTGFIPAKAGDKLYWSDMAWAGATVQMYIIAYDSNNAVTGKITIANTTEYPAPTMPLTLDSATFGSNFDAIRISAATMSENTVITINESIEGGTTTEYGWASTGHAFVPADYEDRIIELENEKANKSEVLNIATSGNILYGKKWVACGDSFTANGYNPTDGFAESEYIYQEGKFAGKNIVYPYIIGLRNNMDIVNKASGGQTMADSSNSFMSVYQSIDADADYITIMLGINDKVQSLPVGNIDDTTSSTFCGAYNTAMEYILEKCPFAHIGIIVSNGTNEEIMTATRNIAERWGIPYLDFGSPHISLMNRYTGRNVCAKAQEIREKNFCVNSDGTTPINAHPNTKAHEFESTFIEAWLRTL